MDRITQRKFYLRVSDLHMKVGHKYEYLFLLKKGGGVRFWRIQRKEHVAQYKTPSAQNVHTAKG